MSARILFLVNGLGLGNSTRCHAIIERLIEKGAEVAVATSGNGLWYFRDYQKFPRVEEIGELHYGKKKGRLSIAATFAALGNFAKVLKQNGEIISFLLRKFSPDVVITDSVYTFKPMKKYGVPIVSLNNADVVYKAYFTLKKKPFSIVPQFYLVELMDYLYHRIVPSMVVSPTLNVNIPSASSKFKRVGPIVRRAIQPAQTRQPASRVVIMLSGSTFSSHLKFTKLSYLVQIDVVGFNKPEGVPPHPNITYHGRVKNSAEILRDADLLIVNGGFSAVSEGFVLRKPLLVIPVPNHAEQWINAKTIENLGVGLMCSEDNFEDFMFKALDSLSGFIDAYDKLLPDTNAAEDAARLILETTKNKL
jgi:uncharacterized protein (TIGR00661 family)